MDRKLHLLESFVAEGSDGARYKICGYEQMVRADVLHDAAEHWEPTGVAEYRTAEGALVEMRDDGSMLLVNSGVTLTRQPEAGG